MLKIRKGDDVIVLAGKYKGQKGIVERVARDTGAVVITGLNMVKRHVGKRVTGGSQGTVVEVAKPFPAGKVAVVNKDGKATRVKFEMKKDKKVRIAVNGGGEL